MTGAAVLWCVVALIFGFATFCILVKIGLDALDEELGVKGSIGAFSIVIISACFTMIAAYNCQKCYDVNFAVAMKNINYTRTTEVNTNIEMNYQDVTNEQGEQNDNTK